MAPPPLEPRLHARLPACRPLARLSRVEDTTGWTACADRVDGGDRVEVAVFLACRGAGFKMLLSDGGAQQCRLVAGRWSLVDALEGHAMACHMLGRRQMLLSQRKDRRRSTVRDTGSHGAGRTALSGNKGQAREAGSSFERGAQRLRPISPSRVQSESDSGCRARARPVTDDGLFSDPSVASRVAKGDSKRTRRPATPRLNPRAHPHRGQRQG